MNREFAKYKQGMLDGNAGAYETIAKWLEEDLAEGRSVEQYVPILRKHAAQYRADSAQVAAELKQGATNA